MPSTSSPNSKSSPSGSKDLTGYALLSVAAALLTLALKGWAFWVTNSVALLSDALESLVNLTAALMALGMLRVAYHPPDEEHAFGHEKAEYFSSGVEGALIVMAAIGILVAAVPRLWQPAATHHLEVGLLYSLGSSAINGGVAWVLLKAGRAHRSITLEADAHHLFSDVWTSVAILLGVGLVAATGKPEFDPLVAILAAVFIAWTGWKLVQRSASGLLDASLPEPDLVKIREVLEGFRERGTDYHALRTRQAGRSAFVQVHILVPGAWTVTQGHDLLEEVEEAIVRAVPGVRVLTHLEPLEEACSFEDIPLDRFSPPTVK